MSDINLELLSDEELIDLALSPDAETNEKLRHSALQEHFRRTKNTSTTIVEPSGCFVLLREKLQDLRTASTYSGFVGANPLWLPLYMPVALVGCVNEM